MDALAEHEAAIWRGPVTGTTLATGFYERPEVIGSAADLPRSRVAIQMAKTVVATDILDIGCGDGALSQAVSEVTGARVSCIDTSQEAVEACRRKGLEAQQLDVGRVPLPFIDQSFDLIIMTEVLEHLVSPDRALEEVRRVLRPGGHMILSTPNLACLPNRLLLTLGIQPLFSEVSEDRVMGRGFAAFGQGGIPVGHLRLYTRNSLLEFLKALDLDVVTIKGAAYHAHGPLQWVEEAVSKIPSLAMILIALCKKRAPDGPKPGG